MAFKIKLFDTFEKWWKGSQIYITVKRGLKLQLVLFFSPTKSISQPVMLRNLRNSALYTIDTRFQCVKKKKEKKE